MTKQNDAALLNELATKKMNEAIYAANTNNLAGAKQAMSAAQSYLDRAIQARGIQGNAAADEFAGYNLNDPNGDKPAAVTGNAGQPVDEFANYSINDL